MAGHPGDVRDERREDPASAAVTDLFRCHHLELVRLALLMTGDLAAAEDVVQDAFEQLHRRWPSLRQPGSGLAYVRSSVLNGCRSMHRRARVARKHAARLAGPPSAGGVPRALGRAGALDEQRCTVLALDRTGQHPLIQCFVMGRFSFGTLAGGHLAPMAGLPNTDCVRECRGPMWGDATW